MNLHQGTAPDTIIQVSPVIPVRLRIAGLVLRVLTMAAFLVVTVRVSSPQSETIWSAYETPGDLIRLALGLVVCVWIVFQMFMLPKDDPERDRTRLHLGLITAPLAIICAIAVW
jgi:hypothetical protein